MFFAAGVGAYQGAMFHLFTHAFFKALLFLGAGSVITAMHHEQDMRRMGGLWRLMPVTYAVMLIGTLSITGVGIPHLELGLSGFYSKDGIIDAAWRAGPGIPAFAFAIGIIAAGLTSFYSWRLIFMTFHGTAKWRDAVAHPPADASGGQVETHDEPLAHDGDGAHHRVEPSESSLSMLVPLILLAVGAAIAGWLFVEYFIGGGTAAFWRGALKDFRPSPGRSVLPEWVIWAPLAVTAAGFACAWYAYVLDAGLGARIAARKGPLWTLLYNKWFFDEIYDLVFVRGAKALGDLFWKGGDQKLIDGLGPDGVSAVSYAVGRATGRLQTGYVYHYAFVILLGVAGLLTYALVAFSK
jgi:NADH-quinone oxidoreductase subunit L